MVRGWIRYLLLPFALLYGGAVRLRGWLYDVGWLRSRPGAVPTLCVGNLAVGGSGKSPHVHHLALRLQESGTVGILSRGYGRRTHGYLAVTPASSFGEVGDEPLMLRRRCEPSVRVAVCEARLEGVRRLAEEGVSQVILDDGFQHRALRPTLSLLLTDYHRPYTDDWYMPVGRLREGRSAVRRAQAVVVTKCPAALSRQEADSLAKRLGHNGTVEILFSTMEYGEPYPLLGGRWESVASPRLFVVAALANPAPLLVHAKAQGEVVGSLLLRDHSPFGESHVAQLARAAQEGARIVTTEKDAVRLLAVLQNNNNIASQVEVWPISVRWLFDSQARLDNMLKHYGLLR